jgi:very-short-patch-repair endonuclease
VGNVLWALATLGWQAGEGAMLCSLEGAAVRVAPSMNAQDVASTVWALATLGWQVGEGAMRCALEGAAVRVAPTMNAQNLASTVWALATLGWQADVETAAVFQQLVEALVYDGGLSERSALSQLLQAHLASQFLGLGLITLPSSVLQVALQAYRDEAQKVTVSKSQQQLGESLRRLGISHELEYNIADGLYSINFAMVERRIALEFDGPSHFTRNTLEPLGHTRLRDRLLSAMGWHVVSIPFFEWDRLQRPEQMDSYVYMLVALAGTPVRRRSRSSCSE